jgi:multiple sugar transport system substrate-binding protein
MTAASTVASSPSPLGRRRRGRLRALPAAVLAGVLLTAGLAACGSDTGPPTLTWYINPDNGGQQRLAETCSQDSGGKYTIRTSVLPNDATAQREQLVRRLAAKDASIDLMSLDPVFVPEFASAGFLRAPTGDTSRYTDGVVQPAVESAQWQGKLIAIPFWANTQLLWYRKSVVEKAGLDPDSPLTWDQLIDAAKSTGTTIGVQANRYEGYTVWINALIAGAGGAVIENPQAKVADLKFGLTSDAARQAAEVINKVATSGVGGPGLANEDEEAARSLFQGDKGGFMVNWPYVWQAANAAVDDGSLDASVIDDIGWTTYPRTVAGEESAPPFGGIELALGAYSDHPDLAQAAADCITSPEHQKAYMLDSGNPAARTEVYSEPDVVKAFPMADVIVQSLERAAPRPLTPYYQDVSASLQRIYHPPGGVRPGSTGREAQDLIRGVLNKEVLL